MPLLNQCLRMQLQDLPDSKHVYIYCFFIVF